MTSNVGYRPIDKIMNHSTWWFTQVYDQLKNRIFL